MRQYLIIFILAIIQHAFSHVCQHDSLEHPKLSEEELDIRKKKLEDRKRNRILESVEPQPFRVTYDASELSNIKNGSGMTEYKKNYIIRIMDSAVLFLNNMIKVNQRKTPLKSQKSYKDSCGADNFIVFYSDELKYSGSGIPNSDLHLLVTYTQSSKGFIASAGYCELSDPSTGYFGPIIGRVQFNLSNLQTGSGEKEDHIQFQDNFAVSLHEMTHVLGFSSESIVNWVNPETKLAYDLSKVKVEVPGPNQTTKLQIRTKNIIKTAQKHFNCDQIEGMFLENQGATGSVGSHWERDLVSNEYMTASAVQYFSVFSEFTAALLRDTGYYAEINTNLVDDILFGKNKGCDFFYNTCNSQNKYEEFQNFGGLQDNSKLCLFNGAGIGYMGMGGDQFSQCYQASIYINGLCEDARNLSDPDSRQLFGPGQKCFYSTIMDKKFLEGGKNRCLKFKCSPDYKTIEVNYWQQETVTCQTPLESIKVNTSTTNGSIKCPDNFKAFCTYPKFCKNFCSSNGVCRNGHCLCLKGYAGEDCSIQCASPNVYDGTNCIQKCGANTYKNPDNTCQPTCPYGYYKDASKNECFLCHRFCSVCTGPSSNQCSSCHNGYDLSGQTCSELICHPSCFLCSGTGPNDCKSCPSTKYLDSQKSCQPCLSFCKICSNNSSCTECLENYSYDQNTKQCVPGCDSSCKTCSANLDSGACKSCPDGRFLFMGKYCQICSSNCSKCENNADNCTDCYSGFTLSGNTCYKSSSPTCNSPCKTCKENSNIFCASCDDKFYLDGNQCKPCVSPCLKCLSASQCINCISDDDYNYSPANQTCNIICHYSCKTCSSPNSKDKCTGCANGSILVGSTCALCNKNCTKCEQTYDHCTECASGYTQDSSTYTCNITCNSPCSKCVTGSGTKCTECVADYKYNSSFNTCSPICHSACLTCKSPNDNTNCQQCNQGFYISGSSCLACESPCKTCLGSATSCRSCINTSYQYDSTNYLCKSNCHSFCTQCTKPNDSTACSGCIEGYYLSGNSCLACNSPCKSCLGSATSCRSCIDASYEYNSSTNQCKQNCHSSCTVCTKQNDSTACQGCVEGYYLSGNSCLACNSPCKTCLGSPTSCRSCINTSYQYDSTTNQCKSNCHSFCTQCTKPNDSTACSGCIEGYYLSGNSCLACNSPCKSCQGSATSCRSCIDASYEYNSSTNQCKQNCHSSCTVCTKQNDSTACQGCVEGYYLSGNSCLACYSPCKSCLGSATSCRSCINISYEYDSSTNQCKSNCHSFCIQCTKPNDSTACSKCADGYYLDGTTCKACISPCKLCSSANQCLTCVSTTDFNYNSTTKSCDLVCHSSCKTCSQPNNMNSCKDCNDGFYLNMNKCQSCTQPCSKCTEQADQCTDCVQGYKIDSQKKCNMICHSSCKTCNVPNSDKGCTSCDDGKYISNNQCLVCQSPCSTCNNQASKCTGCVSNYKYDGNSNQCNPICDLSCKSCTLPQNSSSCTSCNSGFFLNSQKQCIQCQSPCKTCEKSESQCQTCVNDSDYIYNSQKQSCDLICFNTCKSCSKPNDKTACSACVDGFYLAGTVCNQCQSPCLKCVNSQTQCTQCEDNYTLNSFKCIPSCDKSCETCSKPQDKNSCLTCRKGYVKIGSVCKQCVSPCLDCQNTETECKECIESYKLNGNVCEASCHFSCNTCDKLLNENSCKSCNAGFYLDGKDVGKCIQCKSPCKTCNSEIYCDTCQNGYKSDNKGGCLPICDASCETCSSPNDRNSCLSCFPPLILKSSTCQSCNNGQYYDNKQCHDCPENCQKCSNKNECLECNSDFSLDIQKKCVVQENCHFTCNKCFGNEYFSCTSCASNRELKITSYGTFGICECPSDTSDLNEQRCDPSNAQQNMKTATAITFATSITAVSILSILTANPVLLLSLLEFSQNVSYLGYVNKKQPLGFDQIAGVVSYSHFAEFMKPKSMDSKSSQRILMEEGKDLKGEGEEKPIQSKSNPKLELNNKTHYFLLNALFIIIIQSLSWIMSAVFRYLSQKSNQYIIKQLKKIFCISVPMVLFVVCSQELWLLIIYQFQVQTSYDSGLEVMSFLFCLLSLFYMLGFLGYLFYKLEIKKCIRQYQGSPSIQPDGSPQLQHQGISSQHEATQIQHEKSQMQHEGSPQMQPQQSTVLTLQIPSTALTHDIEKFYFIAKYVRQDNFMTRNMIQIIVIVKFIISCVSVCGMDNPTAQIVILILCNVCMIMYFGIIKPLKSIYHNVFLLSMYFIEAVITIIYSISISYENDASASKNISLVMVIIMIIVFIVFTSYSLVLVMNNVYKRLKEYTYGDIKTHPKPIPQVLLQSPKEESHFAFQIAPSSNNLDFSKTQQMSQRNLYNAQSYNNVKVM